MFFFFPIQSFNVDNSTPINLEDFIEMLEYALVIKAIKDYQPIQSGDVIATFSDSKLLENWIQFQPSKSFKKGIDIFASWYLKHYQDKLFQFQLIFKIIDCFI